MAESWIEIRCTNLGCRKLRIRSDGTLSNAKLLGLFTEGGLTRFGKISLKCPTCHTGVVVTDKDQTGNGFSTFQVSALGAHRPTATT